MTKKAAKKIAEKYNEEDKNADNKEYQKEIDDEDSQETKKQSITKVKMQRKEEQRLWILERNIPKQAADDVVDVTKKIGIQVFN